MAEAHNPFVALLLITGLAVVVPFMVSRVRSVRLPIVVGEIIAGIIIGRTGFNLVAPSATLDFLAEFGFAFLMFLSGLEIDYSLITTLPKGSSPRDRWSSPLPLATGILVATFVLAIGASALLQQSGLVSNPFLFGLILSTTSLGVVAPVLKERGLLNDRYGQSLLVAATLADFVTLLLLTVVIAINRGGVDIELLLIPVLLVAFVLVARAGQLFVRIEALRRLIDELNHATSQIRVRIAFALMVAWVVLAEALGVELILGAFLAGAVISLIGGRDDHEARSKLDAIGYGFFIPIFFIMVGVEFNLRALFGSREALLLVPVLVGISYLVKMVPALLLRTRYSWRDSLAGGALLSSRLSLIIAASAIALEIGAITEAVETDIILDAILTTTFSPMIFNRLLTPRADLKRRGLIIAGSDQLTAMLAERLHVSNDEITVVTRDGGRAHDLRRDGLAAIEGHSANRDTLAQAGAATAEGIIVIARDQETLLETCRLAKEEFAIPNIVADVTDIKLVPELTALGVRVVQPALATAMALEGALRFPTAFDLLSNIEDEYEVQEIELRNWDYAGRALRQTRLPGNAVILSVKRDGAVMVPRGDTMLQIGDSVALVGYRDDVEEAVALLGR